MPRPKTKKVRFALPTENQITSIPPDIPSRVAAPLHISDGISIAITSLQNAEVDLIFSIQVCLECFDQIFTQQQMQEFKLEYIHMILDKFRSQHYKLLDLIQNAETNLQNISHRIFSKLETEIYFEYGGEIQSLLLRETKEQAFHYHIQKWLKCCNTYHFKVRTFKEILFIPLYQLTLYSIVFEALYHLAKNDLEKSALIGAKSCIKLITIQLLGNAKQNKYKCCSISLCLINGIGSGNL
ncbi:hypothetical protein TrispH2_006242 [Trichoplax sp. H2]|nr:hypothetical protein TrispH2_006242 [Trichoplax sp. H2]|eukprot:RDD40773.1 hypothetical protein TrispH2_006242 [Trichoplax sp. H2]